MRLLVVFCFYLPLFMSTLNVQAFIGKFISESISQSFAYINVLLVLLGMFLVFRIKEHFTNLIKMWIIFYISYYLFAIFANILLDSDPSILKSLVSVTYFFGFAILLSIPKYRKPTLIILTISFFSTALLVIILNYYNFSMDFDGVYEYKLQRAGGVYGDANNSAVSAILSFIFVNKIFQPKNLILKIIKISALAISSYAILLTFSKTGFLVFLFVLGLTYHKLFSIKRFIFTIVLIPILIIISINWALSSSYLSTIQKSRIESFSNLLTLNTDKVQFSGRDRLLKNMLNYIYENPIIGNGVGFSNIIRGHNTIFGVWADAGIITFIILLIMLGMYFKQSFFAPNDIKYFSLSILITLSIFMLSLQTIINQPYLMVVFILLGYLLKQNGFNVKINNN